MTDLENLLELRKFFKLGIDLIRQDKTLHEIIHGEVESEDPDESGRMFEDLEPIESAALLLGCACALEDVIGELPKRTVRKAKKAAFHTDDVGDDDEF